VVDAGLALPRLAFSVVVNPAFLAAAGAAGAIPVTFAGVTSSNQIHRQHFPGRLELQNILTRRSPPSSGRLDNSNPALAGLFVFGCAALGR
jgi:hypothetical protein